jgi:hypothetical protein
LLGIGVIAALVIGFQVAAFAVHDEVFQLEGNAVTDVPPLPPAPASAVDDWENVFEGTSSAEDTAFVTELNKNSSIFTGGGSKDQQDIPNWAWKDGAGGLPDKDNLEHSFAASYTTGGKELLYFGADRFDGSGDAAIGFWFFKDEVTLGDIKTGGGFNFNGVHTLGDILVLSNFSNGGTVSTISVYKWNPAVSGNLELLATSAKADCSTLTATDPDNACAIVNNAQDDDTVPWPFTDKDGNHTYLPGEFFEGGIDLTALGLSDQCFSTALAETRSSTSVTATLKDFTLGSFGTCGSGTETHPVLASDGSAIPAGGVTSGTAVKDSATITVDGTSTWSGTMKFFLCTPAQLTNNVCSTGGTQVGSDIPVSNTTTQPILSAEVNTAANPLAAGTYCFRGEFSGDATKGVPPSSDSSASECFTVRQPTTVSTAQRWIPQDTATVTPAGTPGTVTFTLYDNLDCTGTVIAGPFTDSSAPFATNNTTITDDTTVSWRASFDATGADDSTSACETATVSFDNDGP